MAAVVVSAASAATMVSLIMRFMFVGYVYLLFAGFGIPALPHTPLRAKSLTVSAGINRHEKTPTSLC